MYQDLINTRNCKETAITFMQNKMSRKDLIMHIDNMAGFLYSIGVRQKDKVAIISPNVPSAIIAFYAINKLGALSNIFHPLVAPNDLINKIKLTDTKVVFMYDLFYRKYKKVLNQIDVKVVIISAKDYLDPFTKFIFSLGLDLVRGFVNKEYTCKDFKKNIPSEVVYNEDACLLHSSGTDKEKTVILTNANFIELKKKMEYVVGKENYAKERTLVSLPIFHCFGLGIGVHVSLCLGNDIVLMPTFNPKSMVRLVDKYKVTTLIVIPSMVKKFISCNFGPKFSSVKHIYCGGDKLSESIRKRFNSDLNKFNDIKLLEGYGLTELTGVCVVNTEKEYKEGTIGKPIVGVDAVILDEEGNTLSYGNVGELALSSSTIMKSYYDLTTNTIEIDGKTYFKSGDYAKIDEDGFITFVGRKKEIIKIGGINVFPRDIENEVCKVNGVKESICIEKDIESKPYTYLFIVSDNKTDELKEDIYKQIELNMLKYCLPKEIFFVDTLPLNKNGKVDKVKLKELIK